MYTSRSIFFPCREADFISNECIFHHFDAKIVTTSLKTSLVHVGESFCESCCSSYPLATKRAFTSCSPLIDFSVNTHLVDIQCCPVKDTLWYTFFDHLSNSDCFAFSPRVSSRCLLISTSSLSSICQLHTSVFQFRQPIPPPPPGYSTLNQSLYFPVLFQLLISL